MDQIVAQTLGALAEAHPLLVAVVLLAAAVFGTTYGAYKSASRVVGRAMRPLAPAMRELVGHLRSLSDRITTLEDAHEECCGPLINRRPPPEVRTNPAFKLPVAQAQAEPLVCADPSADRRSR